MNPRYFQFLFICLLPVFLSGQTTFTSTKVKLRGDEIRLVKILTDNRMAPVLLLNESKQVGETTDWYIFLENGGSINLHMDDSLDRMLGHAQLGQQFARITELGKMADGDYRWQITTLADTLILAGFNVDQGADFACLLYKQITQYVHPEEHTSSAKPLKKLIPLLKFSRTRSRKSQLDIFETGQLTDYPYLAKIIGAFLATLKFSRRI